jgi:hypothetical protein
MTHPAPHPAAITAAAKTKPKTSFLTMFYSFPGLHDQFFKCPQITQISTDYVLHDEQNLRNLYRPMAQPVDPLSNETSQSRHTRLVNLATRDQA